jgi:hypothetical protein
LVKNTKLKKSRQGVVTSIPPFPRDVCVPEIHQIDLSGSVKLCAKTVAFSSGHQPRWNRGARRCYKGVTGPSYNGDQFHDDGNNGGNGGRKAGYYGCVLWGAAACQEG